MTLPLAPMRQAMIVGGSQRHVDPPGPVLAPGVAPPPPPAPTVASVTISPQAFSVIEGGTVQNVTAEPKTSAGVIVSGKIATWTTSSPATATVAPTSDLTATVTGVAAGSPLLFADPCEDGNFSGRGWYDGGFTFDQNEGFTSPGSIKAEWQIGQSTPSPNGMRLLFPETDTLHFKYHVKYSNNFVGSGQSFQPHEWNFLTNVDGAFIGPSSTSLTAYLEHNYQSGLIPLLALQDGRNVDINNVGVDLVGVSELRSAQTCNGFADSTHTDSSCFKFAGTNEWYSYREWRNGGSKLGTVAITDAAKNSWNKIEVYYQLNTVSNGIGIADGVMRYWLNDTLLMEHTGVLFRTGQHQSMKFNQLLLKPFMTNGSSVNQTIWYDDIEIRGDTGVGTATITGTIDGISGTSVATVIPSVITVTTAPSSLVLDSQSNESSLVSATVLDNTGAPVPNRTMNWSSSDSGIASVVAGAGYTATVTAGTPGTAVITATVDGVSDTISVTSFTVATGSALWPNEPPGATIIRDECFDLGNAAYRATWFKASGTLSTIIDPTAPVTGGLSSAHPDYRKVGVQTERQGAQSGFSATKIDMIMGNTIPSNQQTFYMACWNKFTSVHTWHGGGLQKWFEHWQSPNGMASIIHLLGAASGDGHNYSPGMVDQRVSNPEGATTDGNFDLQLDVWYRIEYLWTRATGNQKIWTTTVGGSPILRVDHTHPGQTESNRSSEVMYLTLRGGTGEVCPQDQDTHIDWIRWSYT